MNEPSPSVNATFWPLLRLLRPFWRVLLPATAAGMISGGATAWLLAVINASLHRADGPGLASAVLFALLCLLSAAGNALAGIGNSVAGQQIIATLRKSITADILTAPVDAIERQPRHKMLAVLNGDIDTISAFTFNFSSYIIALAITLGCLAYLAWLSLAVLLLTVLVVVGGVAVVIQAKRGWMKNYEAVRDAQDILQQQYRAIIEGAKELRLSPARRRQVYDERLCGAADSIATLKIRAMRLFWTAEAAGSVIFFAEIGLLLLFGLAFSISPLALSGAVLVLLYLRGPVEQIATAIPVVLQAQVSLRRVAVLQAQCSRGTQGKQPLTEGGPSRLAFTQGLTLDGVAYSFRPVHGGQPPFTLGPIDLTIRPGEVVFIVGENGSGKTTLIKLLLGLYAPQSGEIRLDGVPVTAARLPAYRNLFSVVFTDYHLFDDLFELSAAEEGQVRTWLQRLEIAHKVTIEDGRFSTTDLSTGQRKRLALIQAWMEKRPVLVFDEWAADQDPAFRRLFYDELLPQFRREGRTIMVITHDDQFFAKAQRIVRLHGGKIMDAATDLIAIADAPHV